MSTEQSHWGDASSILAEAAIPEAPSYYRSFTRAEEKAVLTVPMRIQHAWELNDPDLFAETFADNGSLLMQDTQLTSREDIRSFMRDGFQGPFKGARVRGGPLSMTFLTDDVAVVVSEGGIILSGEDDVSPQRRVRVTWIVVREQGGLRLLSHQSSPLAG
ncbi:SgcJ/EcaC family oxidoreductase [Streptomyces sp. V4-01]|uniref:SgcJ/EcaC family oxidoreductase n=1 Tax=Actinacidiphila polyblastidii TaxID=3110430 RepID=A0ABU7PC19_9ACTN|nr:SgcJ/EcaC family oxidoreductase [Streptomyces sp. V4-01]